jgi:ABC-2 type transport system permease protein
VGRYFRLLQIQLRASALIAAQYRWDFVIDGAVSLLWTATAVVPLFIVYGATATVNGIPGWSLSEALVVIGWFILLQGVLEGAINPGLTAVVEHIRKGTLDFVLLKPADAQFLVSTSRFSLWRVTSVLTGLFIFVLAFSRLGRPPSGPGIIQAALLLVLAVATLYSLWILIVSLAFYVVKVDNLTYLFTSIFDAARWPATVFRGALHFVFTFVVPLALMTTYPAEALLGRLEWSTLLSSLAGTGLLALISRQVWLMSIRRYTSASS